jgi:hypothetical protein
MHVILTSSTGKKIALSYGNCNYMEEYLAEDGSRGTRIKGYSDSIEVKEPIDTVVRLVEEAERKAAALYPRV